jgi:tetratricopeptide (TPR) repeat protein
MLRELLRNLVRRRRHDGECLQQARTALAAGRWRSALDLALQAERERPGNADALEVGIAAAEKLDDYREVGAALERAVRCDPSSAVLNEMLGTALRRSGDPQAALRFLERAVEFDDRLVGAWNSLGIARMQLGNRAGAATCFRRALELQPERAEALCNLGILRADAGEFEESETCLRQALQLDSSLVSAQATLSLVLYGMGRQAEAEQVVRDARRHHPQDPTLEFHESQYRLARADWAAGWDAFEKRLQLGEVRSPVRLQRWDGRARAGARIFVYGEQGLGDQIMFASCIPDLVATGAAVTLAVDRRLVALMARSFAGVRVLDLGAAARDPDVLRQQHDCEVALGSLPFHFRRAAGDFPARPRYLRADPVRVAYWRRHLDALGSGLKVGISWRGGTLLTRRSLRCIEAPELAGLLQTPGIVPVSVQYGEVADDLRALRNASGRDVAHWPDALANYDETAALVSALDLVVSVCTSVIHLAGALGQEAWVLVPASPEWRYLRAGDALPWYPRVRLFRQESLGNWTWPLTEVTGELRRRASGM